MNNPQMNNIHSLVALLLLTACISESQQQECVADVVCTSTTDDENDASSFWLPPGNPLDFLWKSSDESPVHDPFESIEHTTPPSDKEPDVFKTVWKLLNSVARPISNNDETSTTIDGAHDDTQQQQHQGDSHTHDAADSFMQTMLSMGSSAGSSPTLPSQSFSQVMKGLTAAFDEFQEQLQRTFAGRDMALDRFDPIQIWYSLLDEEARKNAVWKRKQHRFLPALTLEQSISLADGLYLAHLAYSDSCAVIHDYLRPFQNNAWLLMNCTTTGQPSQPAHFVAVRKTPTVRTPTIPLLPPFLQPIVDSQKNNNEDLEIAVVIRGTKEIGDALSDALFESSPYRGGLAHHGILQSAKWLHSLYRNFFRALLTASPRSRIKLWLVGHSLGGGTAALASMEFNAKDNDIVQAHSLGFGSPAVLSHNLSATVQSSITTVINDADCIPRMSMATLANAWFQSVTYNHTDDALDDAKHILAMLEQKMPMGNAILPKQRQEAMLDWIQQNLRDNFEPLDSNVVAPMKQELIPPGDCIHLYRDGMVWQGNFMPCHRFNEVERVRHMVSDHLIDTGYYLGLLGIIRTLKNDPNWRFEQDLLDIPMS